MAAQGIGPGAGRGKQGTYPLGFGNHGFVSWMGFVSQHKVIGRDRGNQPVAPPHRYCHQRPKENTFPIIPDLALFSAGSGRSGLNGHTPFLRRPKPFPFKKEGRDGGNLPQTFPSRKGGEAIGACPFHHTHIGRVPANMIKEIFFHGL